MQLYLLRHGLTQHNLERRYQGALDSPLAEVGRAQLCRASWQPGRVYVSPLRRARETASILFPEAMQLVVKDLQEMHFGEFEGHTYQELAHDPVYMDWVTGNCLGSCPGGESKAAFCARTCTAVEEIVEGSIEIGEPVVIVAHGGTQMAVMERFAQPQRDYFSWQAPCGGGYLLEGTETEWRARRILHYLETVRLGKEAETC